MPSTNTDLQVLFDICQGTTCSTFSITDTTGTYDVNHLTAWGTPNPGISDVDTATLTVTFPDTSSTTLDLLTLSSGLFPNTSDVSYEVTMGNLGLSGSSLTDGVYTFTYEVTGDTNNGSDVLAWSSSKTIYVLFDCQTRCCLDSLFTSITSDECQSCNNAILDRVTKAYMYLESAQNAACCGSIRRSTKLLNAAQFLCNQTNCQNC